MSHVHQPTRARPARERLLVAAEELFYAEGISSTGVDAVIERAGVATGSLYKNFTGKDALVAAYLERRDQRWRSLWETCIAEHAGPSEQVLALFTAMDRWHRSVVSDRGCAHVAAAIQLPPDHPGSRVVAGHKKHLSARLRELCDATGAPDPDELAQDLIVIYEGMLTMITLQLDPDPVARARRLAVHLLGDATRGDRTTG